MSEDDFDPRSLDELEKRLRQARDRRSAPQGAAPPSKLGAAFRLSTELVAAVVVGGGIGWVLDWLLGTSPFLLIAMFFLGVATGFLNVVRAAREMNKDVQTPSGNDG
ncbi:MAG: AtpZ/AtpI family protein [Proteobacteria bacterium]|nr:AtpZ/AtpI family protein [Pseudomonadota bacterium]